MLKRGVYAASLSILNKDLTLNVEATISHGEHLIKNGCTGVFYFGSTGASQLLSLGEKKEFILTFFLDPEVVDDKKTSKISDVTLSFTFFSSDYFKKDKV